MKYLIFLIVLTFNVYADMSCSVITNNMDRLNRSQLKVKHSIPADLTKQSPVNIPLVEKRFYTDHVENSLSYYLKSISSDEFTDAQKLVFKEIIKEISQQKEMQSLNKIQKYYAQQYIQSKCDDKDMTESQLYTNNLCKSFMKHVGNEQVSELGEYVGEILLNMNLKEQRISKEELSKLCKENKDKTVISRACTSAEQSSKCPNKMEMSANKCVNECSITQYRNPKSPFNCIEDKKLQVKEKERRIRNKAAWGTAGRTAAVIVAAGGAVTLAAWAITSMNKNKVVKHEYTYNHEYTYKTPSTYSHGSGYGTSYGNSYGSGYGDSFNYGPYQQYSQYPIQPQQSSSTPYWNDESAYSFGF